MESEKKKERQESFPLQQRERGEKGRKPMAIWSPPLPSKHNHPPPLSLSSTFHLQGVAMRFKLVQRL